RHIPTEIRERGHEQDVFEETLDWRRSSHGTWHQHAAERWNSGRASRACPSETGHCRTMDVMNTLRSGRAAANDNAAGRPEGSQGAAGTNTQTRMRKRWSQQGNLSRRLARAFFTGNGAIQQSDAGNTRPTRMILK